jgi:POT family proton-dependent oligopeptide transporter
MAFGHFLMAFEPAFLYALLALIVGSGLLKGNLVAQVGQLYDKHDTRRDRGFSLYTVSINIGAVVGPLICGTLGEKIGWHYGFTVAGFGMLVGLAIYLAGRNQLPPDAIEKHQRAKLQPGDWRPIGALIVMYFIHTLYWIAQTQVWNTYPLWISSRVSRDVGGWEVPVTWFQSLDSFTVLALAPLVIWWWRGQAQRKTEPGDLTKIAIGCAAFAAACVELFIGEKLAVGGQVTLVWPVLFHFICAIGYLFVFPVALALFSRAAPAAVTGMMAGVCYLSLGTGSIVSGWLGRFYEIMSPGTFWLMHGIIVGAGTGLLLLLRGPLSRALDSTSRAPAAAPNAMGISA